MTGLMWFCFLCIGQALSDGCGQLLISGTEHRDDLAGIYDNRNSSCNGRNTYKQLGGPNYLFYNDDIDDAHWAVSTNVCAKEISMGVLDTAMYPEDITGTWQENPGVTQSDDWQRTYGLKVQCYAGFAGCEEVSITNADYGHAGKYTMQSSVYCYGSNSYKHSSKSYYLYNTQGIWVIGDVSCSSYGYIRAVDGSQYPEDVTTLWEESVVSTYDYNPYGDWYTSNIKCKCYESGDFPQLGLSIGAIIGIVVGGVSGLVILIVVLAVCCRKKSRSQPPATQSIPMTPTHGQAQQIVSPPVYPGNTTQQPYPATIPQQLYPATIPQQTYPGTTPQQPYPATTTQVPYPGTIYPPPYQENTAQPPYPVDAAKQPYPYTDPNVMAQQGYGNPDYGLK